MVQYLFNPLLVPSPSHNLHNSTKVNLDLTSIVEAVPYITFLYLFQPNVPQTYLELKVENTSQSANQKDRGYAQIGGEYLKLDMMNKVLYRASLSSFFVFGMVGSFGYLIFATSDKETREQLWAEERSKDILEAEWAPSGGSSVKFCQLIVLFAVICSSPLAVLPAKHSLFTLMTNKPGSKMTESQNQLITFVVILICYFLAASIPNIGSVISIAGATVNPFIGFLFPIIFYLKIDGDARKKERININFILDRLVAYSVILLISIISVIGFLNLFKS